MSSDSNNLKVAYTQPSALDQLGAFAGQLLKDEMNGKVVSDKDTLLKLCISAVTRIAFDDKTERLYQAIKTNFPEYFTT